MKKNTNVTDEDYDFTRDNLSYDNAYNSDIDSDESEGINDFIEEFEYLNED